ncbi:MAG: hypothetical protein L0H93_07895, partial [Nocardioides sp.]|nr:hypothetical protein [Nocardioides sp.]
VASISDYIALAHPQRPQYLRAFGVVPGAAVEPLPADWFDDTDLEVALHWLTAWVTAATTWWTPSGPSPAHQAASARLRELRDRHGIDRLSQGLTRVVPHLCDRPTLLEWLRRWGLDETVSDAPYES